VNRKSAQPVPEPIAQLQRQLDQFRSSQPQRTKLPESLCRRLWNWPGNTACIQSRTRSAGLHGTEEAARRSASRSPEGD